MPRLPQVGGDENNWGELLNEFLEVAHNEDGTVTQAGIEDLGTELAEKASLVGGKIPGSEFPLLTFTDFLGDGTSGNPYRFGTRNLGTYLQELPGYDAGEQQLLYNTLTWRKPQVVTVRVTISGASTASSSFAPIKYNKKVLWNWEMDDNPNVVYNTMLPYFHGGVTSQEDVFPGLTYTDGCGNAKNFDMSIAVFGNGDDLPNFFNGYSNYITLAQLAAVYREGFGIMNHQFGGSGNTVADRYYQVQQQTEELYTRFKNEENIQMRMRTMVNPAADEGYTATAHALGYLGMSSQAGVEALKDGFTYRSSTATATSTPSDFIPMARFHFRESVNDGDYEEYIGHIDTAKALSATSPCWLRGFSHGPGESNTASFALFKDVMDYMVQELGDDVCALNTQDAYEYFETKGLAVKSELFDAETGILEMTIDLSAISAHNRRRDMSLLVDTDGTIASVSVQGADGVTYNTDTGLINIFKERTVFANPAADTRHPRITSAEIPVEHPDQVHITYDMPMAQTAAGYDVPDYTITGISTNEEALVWILQLEETILSTASVTLSYRMQNGDAAAAADGENLLCSYLGYSVVNNSEEVAPEDPELRISLKNGSNQQLYTCDTIAELVTYMSTLNINSAMTIYFNDNAAPYTIGERWTINYSNPEYKITIKNKEGVAYPTIDSEGTLSDLLRVSRSNVRIEGLAFISGKYTADGGGIGDNYSGNIIAQTSNTSNTEYCDLRFSNARGGLKIGGINSTTDANIDTVLIEDIYCTNLINDSITVGIQSNLPAVDTIIEGDYTISNVTIRRITGEDTAGGDPITEIAATPYYFAGKVSCKGIYNLHIDGVTLTNGGTQMLLVSNCKIDVLKNCVSDDVSLYEIGYNNAIRMVDCQTVYLYNNALFGNRASVSLEGCRDIRFHRNIVEGPIAFSDSRRILSIRGNMSLNEENGWAFYASFNSDGGYTPSWETDYVEEEQNIWLTFDFRLISVGLDGEAYVYSDYHHPYSDFRTSFNRGLTSDYGYDEEWIKDGTDHHYLADASIGRNFVSNQIGSITTDAAGAVLTYPADVGAFDKDA